MEKKLANQIAREWNKRFAGSYEPTRTEASVEKLGEYWCVEIRPSETNEGRAFHHIHELATVERYYGVGAWIGYDKQKEQIYAHIY